jgi:acetyl-CoA/propionyl-CoA carboxylase biotin carboxyl carrier protein
VFRSVLVANRGEIACRVLATLRERGIPSVAVYSDADARALHVRQADRAVRLGPAEPRLSYLNVEALLAAARTTGAEAIHPGYGFLAESASFARAVEEAGLVFIGPTPAQAERFGDKRAARAAAAAAGVPVVPGFEPPAGAPDAAFVEGARRLGYPVIVKAALGGGGKGMEVVRSDAELVAACESGRRVAAAAFGEGSLYLEKLLERPRHVEVQIVGDGRGAAIHLGERECSLQRRHQKVLEETPSPGIDEPTRAALCGAAVALAAGVSYRGAGTVEFLVLPDGTFYFLEVNTRLQVEHPVTEMVTGLDLVALQLEVAALGRLPVTQGQVARRGHAVEVRVYAEDPAHDFLPQAGRLSCVAWARGPFVRVDAGVETGSEVTVHYDPILAKVVAWAPERAAALARLARALDTSVVHGAPTNLAFLRALARDPDVLAGRTDTGYLESGFVPAYLARAGGEAPALAVAAAAIAETLGAERAGGSTPATAGGEGEAAPGGNPFERLGRWRLPGLRP